MSSSLINNHVAFDNYNTTTTSGIEVMRVDDTPSLCISEEGTIKLGNDFTISVPELRACIKLIREQAKQAYPEDFI